MSPKTLIYKLNRKSTRVLPSINTVTKIVFIALIAITVTFFAKQIHAQSIIKDKQDAIKKGNNQEAWLNEALTSNLVSFNQGLMGELPLKADGSLDVTTYVPGGAIGITNKMVTALYQPPASGVEYIAQVKDNFLGKPAYAQAQGIGFVGLQPLLPIWKSFRNVIYAVSALIFVIMGIMIMLRVKISPQAVVSIQSSIPQIIITLILVTFSYAIAGLLIDAMYLFQAIFLAILFNSQGGLSAPLFTKFDIFGASGFTQLNQATISTAWGLMFRMVPFAALFSIAGIITVVIAGIAGLATGGAGFIGGLVVGAVGLLLVLLVIAVLLLVWIVKFFFGLLKCYIVVILRIVLAPLEIGMGAIPNSKIGFSSWMQNLIANLAVFPISLIFLVLVNMIIDQVGNGLWQPELIGAAGGAANLATWASGGLFPAALGIAAVAMVSKLPSMIPEFIFSIKPSPWGKAIGEAYKPIAGGAKLAGTSAADYGARVAEKNYEADPGGAGRGLSAGYSIIQGLRHGGVLPKKK